MNTVNSPAPIRKGQQLELEIADLAFGGNGIAKKDGFAIFVEAAAPQDVVRAKIVKKKNNYAEAVPLEIIRQSPFRVQPPCRYSGVCGGCKWQFIRYDIQLHYKQQHVMESLNHIGLIQNTVVHPTIPSERIYQYRNKMEFTCSDKRWVLPEDIGNKNASFALGLHVPGVFDKVLDTDACLLQPDLGNQILMDVKNFIRQSGIPVYGPKTHTGFWRFLMLRNSTEFGNWMVNVITAYEDRPVAASLAEMLMQNYPDIVSIVNNITSKKANIGVGDYELVISGTQTIQDKIGDCRFDISSNSFFQTNTKSAKLLYDIVKQYAGLTGNEIVFDLYTGTGSIAIWLSDSAKEVIGFEIIGSAIADAVANCRLNSIANCRFILGDIRLTLPDIQIKPDLIIIDPPRSGMHKDVVKQVLSINPDRIVYVSCNPSTLARDLSLLKEAYHICEVQPIDMFPHTYHIESVARLERRRSA